MGGREGDVRIYFIYVFFLACTIAGGVFLFMYILKPNSESLPWYPIAGMTLVAIPWLFWFLIYLYRCYKTMNLQYVEHQNHGNDTATATATTNSALSADDVTTSPYTKSSVHSTDSAEHHVHSGVVVEMGNEFDGGGGQECHYEKLQHHESMEEQAMPSLVIV
ncbi:hypothetical protein SESBI_09244 [Sesbania bispinosa]|nr:hypothetical protein SESBI_09244 [Sesbania bispinosa]